MKMKQKRDPSLACHSERSEESLEIKGSFALLRMTDEVFKGLGVEITPASHTQK